MSETSPRVYAQQFKSVMSAVNEVLRDELSDDEVFGLAVEIMKELGKDRRMQLIREERERAGAEKPEAAKPWRSEPASEDQLEFLRQLKIPFAVDITKGEAHDLISAKVGEKKK